jgi:hypothetical protein
MLTKNFYNWAMATLTNKTIVNGYVGIDGTTYNADRTSSVPKDLWEGMRTIYTSALKPGTGNGASAAQIGTGVTPATADDYRLESIITSGISVATPSAVTVTKENDFVAVYATYTVTNTGTTSLAVSEIGLFSTGRQGNEALIVLMDRTVLESPIVINPGEAKPITYTIRFNYPTEV